MCISLKFPNDPQFSSVINYQTVYRNYDNSRKRSKFRVRGTFSSKGPMSQDRLSINHTFSHPSDCHEEIVPLTNWPPLKLPLKSSPPVENKQ